MFLIFWSSSLLFLLENQTKHLHIHDTSHSDGLSYESGDELSEVDYDLRSSQEKLNTHHPPSASPKVDYSGTY